MKCHLENIFCLGLASAVLAICAGPAHAADPRSMDEELRLQQQLLSQVEEGEPEKKPNTAIRPDQYALSVRTAPKAPTERDYPASIFEEGTVVVVPGEWENSERLVLLRRALDADRDGSTEIVRWVDPESMLVVRQMEDRNYDGVQDAWTDYEWGAAVRRTLDANDDGNPDAWEGYSAGRMTSREVDRNDDGVRDAFYRYEGDSLIREEYDSNDDGSVDRSIQYVKRQRVRSEEDTDRDGKMDRWTVFGVTNGVELPVRIESDSKGNGAADIYEMFEPVDGIAILVRKEEDVNGDGSIDVISIFRMGKLVRREILDLAVAPGA